MIPFMAALGNSQMTYDDANSGFIMHVLQKKGKIGYLLGSLTSVYAVTFIETVLVLAADVMFVFAAAERFAGSSAEFRRRLQSFVHVSR